MSVAGKVPVRKRRPLSVRYMRRERQIIARMGLANRPTRVHFTYLDAGHLANGGRRHESFTIGDRAEPEYAPRIVVILENKDTAVYFPPIPGGIAVEGEGHQSV